MASRSDRKPKPRTRPGLRPAAPPDPPRSTSPRWLVAGLSIGLVVVVGAIYLQLRSAGFVELDDPGYVYNNRHVTAGLTGAGVVWAFTTGFLANWHPLTWLSHMLDVQLFGVNAGAHHLVNVAFHALNTLLLFGVLHRMTRRVWPSAIVAALFAVHPLHVESVAWISERKDVLSTMFWLLVMWAYVHYTARPSKVRYALVMVFLALGLMAKPMLVTLPIVLLLLDFWPLQRFGNTHASFGALVTSRAASRLAAEKLPLVLLVIASSAVTVLAQGRGGALSGATDLPWATRIGNALISYVSYLTKTVRPDALVVFYPHPRALQLGGAAMALAALVLVSVAVWRVASRAPYALVGWLWYLITLVPVIGLIQVGTQAMADRYTYVPLIGIFIAATWAALDLSAGSPFGRRAAAVLAAAAIGAAAFLAHQQASYWLTNDSLWRHALAATPDNYRAHNAVGSILLDERKPQEALPHFQEAARLEPESDDAYYNIGRAFVALERYDEAATSYERALAIRGNFAEAHNNLGSIEARRGLDGKAIAHFETALATKPDFAEAHANLAGAMLRGGRLDDARKHAEQAIALNPSLPAAHYTLGALALAAGRPADAIASYREAVRLAPDSAEAHNSLGFVLAGQGQVADAISHFTEAIRLDPNLQPAHLYLALALAGSGRLDEAEVQFREALRLNPGDDGAARGLATVIELKRRRSGK